MPIIDCKLIAGYDETTRELLAERITDAACSSTGAAPEFVTITITEISPNNYMRGRTQKQPAKAPLQSNDIIQNYLTIYFYACQPIYLNHHYHIYTPHL